MGSSPSKKVQPITDLELTKSCGTLATVGVPEPAPFIVRKADITKDVDFDKIDNVALKMPPTLLFGSFWDLIEHLVMAANFDVIDDIYRIRALFRWITSYNVYNIDSEIIAPEESPLEYLMKIRWDFGDHAHMFFALCGMANIPCVIINGVAKHSGYEIGDAIDREKVKSRWNAVFVKGEWRFVDVMWATASELDKGRHDKVIVDDQGNIQHFTDGRIQPINDFFFLCDPDKFIWTHLPDDPKWQLLPDPITQEEFERQPYIRERYHELGMEIHPSFRKKGCIIKSSGKPVKITFNVPPERSNKLRFRYKVVKIGLDMKEDPSAASVNMEKYVMLEHTRGIVRFTVRCPVKGLYKIDIFGIDTATNDQDFNLVCTYIIKCGAIRENYQPFPESPIDGWGPNPAALAIGLIPERPNKSVIKTTTGILEVVVNVKEIQNVSHVLRGISTADSTISRHAIGRKRDDHYIINIRLPKAGEYALKVYAKGLETPRNVMETGSINYLVQYDGKRNHGCFPFIIGTQLGEKDGAGLLGVDIKSSEMMLAWYGFATLKFTVDEDVTLCYEHGCSDPTSKRSIIGEEERKETNCTYDVFLPVAGIYTVNVFGYHNTEPTKVHEIFSCLIYSEGERQKTIKFKQDAKLKRSASARKRRTGFEHTILTKEKLVKIPLPKTSDSVFTALRRCDALDEGASTYATVAVGEECLEVKMELLGEYILDLYSRDKDGGITTLGRYNISFNTKDDESDEFPPGTPSSVNNADNPLVVNKGEIISNVTPRSKQTKAKKTRRNHDIKNTRNAVKQQKEHEKASTEIKKESKPPVLKVVPKKETLPENLPIMNLEHVPMLKPKPKPSPVPKNMMTKKDLDGLVKQLNGKYGIISSTKPWGIGAYFDEKDMKQAKEDLLLASKHREATMLEEAIERAKATTDNQSLKLQIMMASNILGRLSKVQRMSMEGSGPDQKTITELKQYVTPPTGVHHTLAALFLVLGDDINTLKDWNKCKGQLCHMGKDYVFRRMSDFDPSTLSKDIISTVKKLLKPFTSVQIRDVSKGAATIYVWVQQAVREAEYPADQDLHGRATPKPVTMPT